MLRWRNAIECHRLLCVQFVIDLNFVCLVAVYSRWRILWRNDVLLQVTLLLATNLPPNDFEKNAFRNSFHYEHKRNILFIRKERLESIGTHDVQRFLNAPRIFYACIFECVTSSNVSKYGMSLHRVCVCVFSYVLRFITHVCMSTSVLLCSLRCFKVAFLDCRWFRNGKHCFKEALFDCRWFRNGNLTLFGAHQGWRFQGRWQPCFPATVLQGNHSRFMTVPCEL